MRPQQIAARIKFCNEQHGATLRDWIYSLSRPEILALLDDIKKMTTIHKPIGILALWKISELIEQRGEEA